MVDYANFTPLRALAGGALIGGAAALLLLANGRVAGISGIIGALLRPLAGDIAWRIAFVGGLVAAPLLWRLYGAAISVRVDVSVALLVCAGLLVGIGTRYGSGCTSGHGVCGVARLSPRSLVATSCFMLAGFVSTYVLRHVIG